MHVRPVQLLESHGGRRKGFLRAGPWRGPPVAATKSMHPPYVQELPSTTYNSMPESLKDLLQSAQLIMDQRTVIFLPWCSAVYNYIVENRMAHRAQIKPACG